MNVIARLPSSVKFGLALILAEALYFGAWVWYDSTRIWVPLDMPISLASGHIRTPEFRVNVESTYLIQISVDPEFDFEGGPCVAGVRCPSSLRTTWSVWNGSRAIANGQNDPRGRVLGSFDARKGRYILDLDVKDDGRRLNAGSPRLIAYEAGSVRARTADYGACALLESLVMGVVGIFVVISGLLARRYKKQAILSGEFSLTQPGPLSPLDAGGDPDRVAGVGPTRKTPASPGRRTFQWVSSTRRYRKPSPRSAPPFYKLSWISLVILIIFLLVTISVGVLQVLLHHQYPPRGLMIHLLKPEVVAQSVAGIQPVRVDLVLYGPSVLLSSRLVSQKDFPAALEKEIRLRPLHWPVYVEADPDLDWRDVAKTIDVIRGLQAEVVLITPSMPFSRAQAAKRAAEKQASTIQSDRR